MRPEPLKEPHIEPLRSSSLCSPNGSLACPKKEEEKKEKRVGDEEGSAAAQPPKPHPEVRAGQLRVGKEEAGRVFVEFESAEWAERSKEPPPNGRCWPHKDFPMDDGRIRHGWFFPPRPVAAPPIVPTDADEVR